METLVVDLNRDRPHAIDVAVSAFRATDDFEIVLDNHGEALHVFVGLDDDLAGVVELSAGNHFVQEGRIRRVPVDVDPERGPVRGRLEVVTGYGAETAYVTVSVEEPEEGEERVDVDASLAEPQSRPEPESDDSSLDVRGVPALVVGALAVAIALVAALALGDGATLVAALVVLVGAGLAAVLLRG